MAGEVLSREEVAELLNFMEQSGVRLDMKSKIEKFELNDFLILKQDTIPTRGGSRVDVLQEFQMHGLVELVSREKLPSRAAVYQRTEKGKKLYENTLEAIEYVIGSVFAGNFGNPTKRVVKKVN